MDKYSILKQYYGHSAFRAGQEALIDAILSGRDALCVMPTGGGKSLCDQIPALLLPGITLVVSPLISLMKDQVAALKSAGVPAAYINSSLTGEQIRTVYARTRKGAYTLIYVAPERLETNSFLSLMQEMDVSFLAVDEAHCISQWGQDFRPSYLGIVDFINALPRRPIVAAYTATATKQVQSDILRLLQLQSPYRIVTGFDRPNLYFDVRRPKNKFSALAELIDERRGRSGIVYCATRAAVERVCDSQCDRGIAATRYHAGLTDEERQQNQDDFQFDRKTVMVATNAFGMGIDKSNVSFVIHYNMPKSLEAYYQEAGRAGRDGENADCVLLFALAAVLLLPTSTVRISPSARSLSSMLSSFFVISAFAKSSVTLSSPAVKLLPPMPPGRCRSGPRHQVSLEAGCRNHRSGCRCCRSGCRALRVADCCRTMHDPHCCCCRSAFRRPACRAASGRNRNCQTRHGTAYRPHSARRAASSRQCRQYR